jgi:hypothetical protein
MPVNNINEIKVNQYRTFKTLAAFFSAIMQEVMTDLLKEFGNKLRHKNYQKQASQIRAKKTLKTFLC